MPEPSRRRLFPFEDRAREVDYKRCLLSCGHDAVMLCGQAMWPPHLRPMLPEWSLEPHAADMIARTGRRSEFYDVKSADNGESVSISMRSLLWTRTTAVASYFGCSTIERRGGLFRFVDHRRMAADVLFDLVHAAEDVWPCCDDDWRRFTISRDPNVVVRHLRNQCSNHKARGGGGSGKPYIVAPLDRFTMLRPAEVLPKEDVTAVAA